MGCSILSLVELCFNFFTSFVWRKVDKVADEGIKRVQTPKKNNRMVLQKQQEAENIPENENKIFEVVAENN
jgi:hypothetical protein